MTNPTRRNFLLIGSFGLTCALGIPPCLGLTACSSPKKYVDINNEELALDDLREIVQENELLAWNDYIGQGIEVSAPLISVSGPDSISIETETGGYYQHDCPQGYISVGTDTTRYLIELTESDAESAATLNKGDVVHATGTFSGFSDYGSMTEICLLLLDGATTHIEKDD